MKKLFSKIHLWLSIPLGIIITVICLTGAILVFRTEIEEASRPELYFSQEKTGEKLPLSELIPLVDKQLGEISVTSVSVDSDPSRNYIFSTNQGHRSAVYVNPYTGEVVGKSVSNGFFSQMLQLHRWLLIDREIGKPIVGYTTLLLVLILLSGIIICFPKSRKQLKRIFTINVTKGWKRFWYDLHVSGGTWVLIGLLILSLTGLTWSFQWYRDPFYKLFGAEAPQAHGRGGSPQIQPNRPFDGGSEQTSDSILLNNLSEGPHIERSEREAHPSANETTIRKTPIEDQEEQNPASSHKMRNPATNAPEKMLRTADSLTGDSVSGNRERRRGGRPQGNDNPEFRNRGERRGGRPEGMRDSIPANREGRPQSGLAEGKASRKNSETTEQTARGTTPSVSSQAERNNELTAARNNPAFASEGRRERDNRGEAAARGGNSGSSNREGRRGGGGGRPQPQEPEKLNILHWDQLLARIQEENPNYKRISLRNNAATVSQHMLFGNSRGSDRYSFDGDTGAITEHVLYKDSERTTKVRGWIYSIHVGSWGGLFSKIITCLVSLIGATLPATGYYLWIKRLQRKKKSQAKKKNKLVS